MIDHERLKSYIGKKGDNQLIIDYSIDDGYLVVNILWITHDDYCVDIYSSKVENCWWLYSKFDKFA